MDLSLFATQTTKTAPLSGGSNPLFNNGNIDFLTAILGNINIESEAEISASNSEQNTTEAKADLALLQLALLGQDVDKSFDEKIAELKIEELAKTQENRIEQLKKLIDHLTSGLPQEAGNNNNIEDLVTRLNTRLEKLTTSLEAFRSGDFNNEDSPFKLLIATGLNPAQLTKITNRIEEVETKLGRELTVEDLIAGVGNIIPAPGEDDHEFSTTDATLALLNKKSDTDLENSEEDNVAADIQKRQNRIRNYDVPALLNLLNPHQVVAPKAPTLQNTAIQQTAIDDTTILPEDGITPLPSALSNAEFQALFGRNTANDASFKNNLTASAKLNVTVIPTSANSAVPKMGIVGDLIIPTNWNDSLLSQQALSEALGFDIQTGTPFTQTMQAAHISTTATQAGQAHPATATVSAQISKAVQNGDTRNITLHLDPPELGRVEVRLEFGRDNTVKAHLIIEKPETYAMLQRDAASLQNALEDAGMETGSDSLNYEMAEDNHSFGDGKNNRNGHSGTENANQNTTDLEEEIIETTMNWNVDPNTGHVHYNILA